MNCKDSNGTNLSINDAIMYIDNNGREWEGTITNLLATNKIEISCEVGNIIVDASTTFFLP